SASEKGGIEERISAPVLLRGGMKIEEHVGQEMTTEGRRHRGMDLAVRIGAVEDRGRMPPGETEPESTARGQRARGGVEQKARLDARQRHPARSVEPACGVSTALHGRDTSEGNAGIRPHR